MELTGTQLATGMWAVQTARWEGQWQPPRVFPARELLGAEAVLARMMHQMKVSGDFTPLGLADIYERRAYHANGELNERGEKRKDHDWTPLGVLPGGASTAS